MEIGTINYFLSLFHAMQCNLHPPLFSTRARRNFVWKQNPRGIHSFRLHLTGFLSAKMCQSLRSLLLSPLQGQPGAITRDRRRPHSHNSLPLPQDCPRRRERESPASCRCFPRATMRPLGATKSYRINVLFTIHSSRLTKMYLLCMKRIYEYLLVYHVQDNLLSSPRPYPHF